MSRLLDNSKPFRDQLLSKNTFGNNSEYNTSHANAQSDGDEHGKGEKNGQVGSATDIAKKNELLSKNLYGKNKPYNIDVA